MLVIKLELHSAVTGLVTELGRLDIINDGTGSDALGNYEYTLLGKDASGKRYSHSGDIRHWPRRTNSAWALVKHALSIASAGHILGTGRDD